MGKWSHPHVPISSCAHIQKTVIAAFSKNDVFLDIGYCVWLVLHTICFIIHSGFSEEVLYHTSGTAPTTPASPLLINAGVTWLSLQWTKPSGTPSDEGISYILEMEDENSVSLKCFLSI